MGITYENQREEFERVVRAYAAYLQLYKALSGGSTKGATTFDMFYLIWTFHAKYEDCRNFSNLHD